MKTIRILVLCFITTWGYAQKKMTKTSQSIKVDKEVVIDLNTSYVEIEIDTWNRDIVEVEAYIESSKLSEADLKKAMDAWNLKVDGSSSSVIISSTSDGGSQHSREGDYAMVLRDLEMQLADLPQIPEMPPMPDFPEMDRLPALPKLPQMPEMPPLPDLPKGVKTTHFDYERYQKEGESYLDEWSKTYKREGGTELELQMKEWAKSFADSDYQKKMEAWGEAYGKQFEGKWAKDMEEWGEKFGEQFGEEYAKKMEAWGERVEREMSVRAEAMEKRGEEVAKRHEKLAKRNEHLAKRLNTTVNRFNSGSSSSIKKVIKIKIPKKAKLKTNIRHGELKLSSVIFNMKGDITHSFLVAEHIDGGETSINVSYSPVVINTWSLGTLNLNYVDKASITTASNLVLNSRSSNVTIERLTDIGIIDGSFGDLTISNLTDTFKNLNLVLENSDALLNLPKDMEYSLYFKGDRSKYNNKPTTQKNIRNYPEGQSSNRNIIVNAKFSNVIVN